MNSKSFPLACLVLLGLWMAEDCGRAQPSSPEPNRIYTLVSGSVLVDDCPICGRPTIEAPMTGTFVLHFLDQSPVLSRYQLQDVSFQAAIKGGPHYSVNGTGAYQVGGEVAVVQDLFLDLQINNGSTITGALCVNGDRSVTPPWPEIQVAVDQTNGTPAQVYHLTLVAVPALQFRSILPDTKTGNVQLDWETNGGMVQLEQATNVAGPYFLLLSDTTSSSFTDVGALTNRSRSFYRLHQ